MKKTMTKSERRVQIARDALAQYRAKRLEISTGCYVVPDGTNTRCMVCALGGLLVGYFKGNIAKVDQHETGIHETLSKVFTEETLCLAEVAFEKCALFAAETGAFDEDDDLVKIAVTMYDDLSKEECFVAIMKNIIRNKGEFKIPRSAIRAYQQTKKFKAAA